MVHAVSVIKPKLKPLPKPRLKPDRFWKGWWTCKSSDGIGALAPTRDDAYALWEAQYTIFFRCLNIISSK